MIFMVIMWVSASFCYYLITYQLKYIKGDLFINGMVSATSECFAYAISGFLQATFGLKPTLFFSFLLGVIGMICLILIDTDSELVLSVFILGSKFGISSAFNLLYLGNTQMFPMNMIATSYGICAVFARLFTIFSPVVAEIKPDTIPQWMFVAVAAAAVFASTMITKPEDKSQRRKVN